MTPGSAQSSTAATDGERLCPACGQSDTMAAGDPVWPSGWRCPACDWTAETRNGFALFAPELADRTVGMDPARFTVLAEAERRHFWFLQRIRLIAGLVRRCFPEARSLLEIGCGNGAVLAAIAAERDWSRLAGSDLHPLGLRTARARLPETVELVQMDARHIPARNAFDVVGAFDVLEHIEEDQAVLGQIAAALRPGGGVILAVPQHPFLWSGADEAACHVRRYRRGELEEKVVRAGFTILRSTSYVCLLLPLMILSRLIDRSRRGDPEATIGRELAVSPLSNFVLGGLTRLEVAATLAGLSWPVGGSRIVVARRAG